MKSELDKTLCERYPKIFADRYADMTQTAMCWGFDCGDGWFNLLDQLCAQIQSYIDWRQDQYARAERYNQALAQALTGDKTKLTEYFTYGKTPDAKTHESVAFEIARCQPRLLPLLVPQVLATQVKEKFGALRFYYDGGDERVTGMVHLAEALSGATCECCGSPAERRGQTWLSTLCDSCY